MILSDYIMSIRYAIRDTQGIGGDPTLYVFQDTELEPHLRSGIAVYSKYRTRRKPYTLTLQPGIAQYTLPSDWVRVDKESFDNAIGSPMTYDYQERLLNQFASFVLPNISGGWALHDLSFDWYDSDQYVIVNPTPQSTAQLTFSYLTQHNIDDQTSTVADSDADYVVLAAASRALDALAIDRGTKMQKYKIGQGLQIDDSEVAKRLQEQAKTYWDRFENFMVFRPFGVSG
jgi:hypothetical protein